MGVDTRRKPPLPAPTESSTLPTSGDDAPGTDLATDISRVTDRTSFSIPEDGTPLTISTKRRDKLDKSKPSQTSLLIEYFEGGKGPNVTSRPSVRVKVTPSSAKRSKDSKDHIQITESAGARRPSYTRRISLGPHSKGESHIIDENTSLLSAGTESNLSGRPPVEIEVMHKDQFSELSGTSASRINHNLSEVSSMPTDSILEGNTVAIIPERNRSRSLTKDEVHTMDTLKTPSRRRSRSLSRERLAQKVAEKVRSEPRKTSGKHKSSKSRSRSVSKEHLLDTVSSPRRKSSRHHKSEELPSGESSLLTASQVSDGRSFRSGTSKSSYNNPKLLETVEDAIRRLILPELTALKAEQKTQQNKDKFERTRRDSESSISREESSRRVSGRASDPNVRKPKVVLNRDEHNPGLTLSGDSIKKKKSRYDEKCMSEETITRDGDGKSRRRSKDKDGHRIKDAATGALLGGLLTHAALKHHDSKESKSSLERRERRRKRSKSHSRSHSMSTSVTGTDEIFYRHDIPPMPMSSEITGSDLTRDSILSERTSTPTSEHRRAEIRQVARGSPRQLYSPSRRTPEPSPLGQYHENDSRDELSVHSEGSIEKSKRKHHYGEAALAGGAAAAGLLAAKNARDKHYDDHEHLEYRDKRGLSPIQSVASFEEKVETSTRLPHAHSTGSLSSLDKRHSKAERSSMNSISSTGSGHIAHSSRRPKGFSLETGSEILSTRKKNHSNQDLARDPNRVSWYEGADDSDRYRDSSGGDSFRNSKIDVKHLTNYTDDSMDAPYLDKVTAAQQIRGIGANPEYIHTPEAVESAVASLYEPSMLDVRSLRSGHSGVGEGAYLDSPLSEGHHGETQYATGHIGTRSIDRGSPLKHYEGVDEDIKTVPGNVYGQPLVSNSPRQSVASEKVKMSASGIPDLDNPMPEIGHGLEDTRSEISTNPSYINGPGPMDTQNSLQQAAKNMLLAAAAGAAAGAGAGALANRKQKSLTLSEREVSRDPQNHPAGLDEEYHSGDVTQTYDGPNDVYMTNKGVSANRLPHDTMYMAGKGVSANQLPKDEGYITEDQMGQSGGALTPDHRKGHAGIFGADDVYNDDLPAEDPLDNIMGAGALGTFGMPMDDDPFIGGHSRHVSGGSHGMGSPLYDSATGKGMDRIQSQDVIALMDHVS